MPISEERHQALRRFFFPLVQRTCAELGLEHQEIPDYLAGVLSQFSRTDRLYRLRDPAGLRITSVVEMLGFGPPTSGPEGEQAFRRYVAEFALFMSGLFRPFAENGGFLGYYLEEGARSYARVAAIGSELGDPRSLLYRDLAVRFEHYSGALDFLRKVRFPGLGGPEPVSQFLRQISTILDGVSRN